MHTENPLISPPPDAETLYHELERAIAPYRDTFDAFVGIHAGGSWIAERLRAALAPTLPLGVIDVSFYRDDLAQRGLGGATFGPANFRSRSKAHGSC